MDQPACTRERTAHLTPSGLLQSGAFDNRSLYEGEEGEEDEDEEGMASDDSTDDPADTIRCYMCDHANHSSVLLLCDGPGCPRSAHTW